MLESPSGRNVLNIPGDRERDFAREMTALNAQFPDAEAAIRSELNRYIATRTSEFCSSWVPGADWHSGSFQHILETMLVLYVNHHLARKRAGWFFGLILMDVIIRRPDWWIFRR